MKISNITFSVQKQGDCVFNGTATWTPVGAASSLTTAGTTTKIAKGNPFESEDHIVIPNQDLTNVKATFTVEFYDASDNKVYEKEYTNVALALTGDAKWQPGYLYKYTGSIKPTTSYIEFNVISVEDWQNATPSVSL